MRYLLTLLAVVVGGCTSPASQAPGQPSAQDTAAVLSAALLAYSDRVDLDVGRRLWLEEPTPRIPVSEGVLRAVQRVAPGLRRIPEGLQIVRCAEGESLSHPGTSCPLAEDGVRIRFAGVNIERGTATVVVNFLYPSYSGAQEVHLVLSDGGAWVFDRFGVTIVS